MKGNEKVKAAIATCVFILALCPTGIARIIYVDNDGPADFNAIQAAIDDAHDGDTVIIRPGTYTGPGNRDIDFKGRDITVQGTEPNDPNVVAATIIDCGGTEIEPHRGFMLCNGEDANSVLSGLTITRGWAPQGAGVYMYGSSPTLLCCNVIGNICGPPRSSGRKDGAGIFIRDGSPYIGQCLIADNRCDGAESHGGGVFCYNARPTIRDCWIKSNQVRDRGAGVHCEYGSNLTLSGCTITNNWATFRTGGGVSLWSSKGLSSHCLITGNRSGEGGAGVYLDRSETSIRNCTIVGNRDSRLGGGVRFSLGKLLVVDTILWSNSAPDGPQIAIYTWAGVNYDRGPMPSEPQINALMDVNHCDIEGGYSAIHIYFDSAYLELDWGDGNIDAEPSFVSPGYWSPSANPAGSPWIEGDCHLKSQAGRWEPGSGNWAIDELTSPCIDAGDPNSPVGDEPEPNGGRINMGAYGGTAEASKSYFGEPVCETIIAGDINGDCHVDFADLALMASHWLWDADALPTPVSPDQIKR